MSGGNYEIRGVRLMQVIEVTFVRGKGCDGDPIRHCTAYFDTETKEMLAEHDSFDPNAKQPF